METSGTGQGILHFLPKFGDPSLNRWWVIVPRSSKWGNFWLCQGQSPPKTIGILTKVFYTYGPNLVILAWTGDELSRGQASDYRTHGRTDGQTHRQTQATTIPEGRNWPRVKMYIVIIDHKITRPVNLESIVVAEQIARFMGPTWGPPVSCRPHVGPMSLLSGYVPLPPSSPPSPIATAAVPTTVPVIIESLSNFLKERKNT